MKFIIWDTCTYSGWCPHAFSPFEGLAEKFQTWTQTDVFNNSLFSATYYLEGRYFYDFFSLFLIDHPSKVKTVRLMVLCTQRETKKKLQITSRTSIWLIILLLMNAVEILPRKKSELSLEKYTKRKCQASSSSSFFSQSSRMLFNPANQDIPFFL